MNTHRSMYEHFTDGVSPSKPFISKLREQSATWTEITNKDAYRIYALWCAKHSAYGDAVNDLWCQMNARNQMCKLEHFGILIRIRPGVYHWNTMLRKYSPEDILDLYATQQHAANRRRAEVRARYQQLMAEGHTRFNGEIYDTLVKEAAARNAR